MDKVTASMLGQRAAQQLNESMEAENKARFEAQEKLREEIAYRDSIVKENREEMAEKAQKEREQMFIAQAEIAFFKANPGATESDFKRLLPKITDEFLLGNFRDVIKANAPEYWETEMN